MHRSSSWQAGEWPYTLHHGYDECRQCVLPTVGLSILQALLLSASGSAFGLTLFVRNSFALVFMLLLLVNVALAAFGFFISSLLRRAAG